jgi:DNA-binding beta-propeller fold protein YncE
MRRSRSLSMGVAMAATLGVLSVWPAAASASPSAPSTASTSAFPAIQLSASPVGVAVDPATHLVYAAEPAGQGSEGGGLVAVVDAATLGPPGSLTAPATPPVLLEELSVGDNPVAVGIDTSTHIAYVAEVGGVTMINGAAEPPAVGATIPDGDSSPLAIAVDSVTHTVFVTDQDGAVEVIDAAVSPPTVTSLAIDSARGVAVDPTTHLAYVTEDDPDLLAVIDGTGHPRVVQVIHLGDPAVGLQPGAQPEAVAVDPASHRVFVANHNGTIQVISGNQIIAGFRTPSFPYSALLGAAVDSATHTVYVTDVQDGVVWLVDGAAAHPAVTASLPVGDLPFGVADDPSTGTAYVANQGGYVASQGEPSISVLGPPSILTPPPAGFLPDGQLGSRYSAPVQAFGGGSPYTWTAAGLPAGLSIDPASGVISGYPTDAGTSQVTVTVTAALGTASKRFSLTIARPPKTNPCTPGTCV